MPIAADTAANLSPKSLTREELYELAWKEPMLRLGERFGVSSSYLARVFTELRVPRPAPGYWAQLEFGKSPPKPDLPPARPGDLTDWSPGASVGTAVRSVAKASRNTEASAAIGTQANEATKIALRPSIKKAAGAVKTAAAKRHELLSGVKPLFLRTRKVENDILRPYKRLLVDVMASKAKLDDALDAAQVLFEALNRRGFHIGFAPAGGHMRRAEVDLFEKPADRSYHRTLWAPERPTVVYVGSMPIGLTIFEMTEEVEVVYANGGYVPVRTLSELQLRRLTEPRHWRSKEEHASGRLCLQAYCPSRLVDWSKRWQESKPGSFRGLISSVVSELEAMVPVLEKQLQEAQIRADEEHRRWEEQQRQWKAEAERARRDKATKESRADLMGAIVSWDEARRVQDYFDSVEAELHKLPAEEATLVRERLRLAKELVGSLNSLGQLKNWKTPDERLTDAPKSLWVS